MKLLLLALVLAVCGCGVVESSDPDAAPGVDAAAVVDAAPPDSPPPDGSPRTCSPTAPFTSVIAVTELNSANREERVTLSADELELYLTRFNSNVRAEIWRSRRASTASVWSAPVLVAALNTRSGQAADAISPDGLTLYMTGAEASDEIMVATRSSPTGDFGAPSLLANVNSSARELWASIDPQNRVLHFVSHRNSMEALYRAERASTLDPFGTPTLVAAPAGAFCPVFTPDGLGLYYSKLASGGKFEAFYASRPTATAPFGAGMRFDELTPVNGGWASWVSADQCRMYFTTQRAGGAGDLDIYLATRQPQ